MSPASNEILKDRSRMLSIVRSFFSNKNILEVDVPAISKYPAIDLHIDVMQTEVNQGEIGYLHTSPEYLMKRLLTTMDDIYFLGHVFRKNEIGNRHSPEFTMIEWYRKNISYEDFLQETLDLIDLFLPDLPHKQISFRKLFLKHTEIDYLTTTVSELLNFAKKHIDIENPEKWSKDDLIDLIMTHIIEPNLGENKLLILDQYPSSRAMLSKTKKISKDETVAERFEIYYKGIELANGFHELTDHVEQEKRLIQANLDRINAGKKSLPLDKNFLQALEKGIGDCYGVAVGFDRLMMLKCNKSNICEIMPFFWNEN